jgi:hypothetical protein
MLHWLLHTLVGGLKKVLGSAGAVRGEGRIDGFVYVQYRESARLPIDELRTSSARDL